MKIVILFLTALAASAQISSFPPAAGGSITGLSSDGTTISATLPFTIVGAASILGGFVATEPTTSEAWPQCNNGSAVVACGWAQWVEAARGLCWKDAYGNTAVWPHGACLGAASTGGDWSPGGYQALPYEAGAAMLNGSGSFSTTPMYYLFVAKASDVGSVRFRVSTAHTDKYLAIRIYDSAGTAVTGAAGNVSVASTGAKSITLTGVTLTPGTSYYFGFCTDGTTAAFLEQDTSPGAAGMRDILNVSGAERIFTGATACTGAGATLALPSSFGTKTGWAYAPAPLFVLMP